VIKRASSVALALFISSLVASTTAFAEDPAQHQEIVPGKKIVHLPKRHFRRLSHKDGLGLPGVHHAKNMAVRHYLKTGKADIIDKNGYRLFPFGTDIPHIKCSLYHICDIALQKGEIVRYVAVGDKFWQYKKAVSGAGPNERPHLIIEPLAFGYTTSMFISTTRRTYNILLESHKKQFMPRVAFWYPDDWVNHFEAQDTEYVDGAATPKVAVKKTDDNSSDKNTKTLYVAHPENLRFNYKIFGDHPGWTPDRVYDDGLNTYIHFPDKIDARFHPGIFLLDRRGEGAYLSYNMDGNTAIIHQITRKMMLVYGVGATSEKVIIERKRPDKKGFFSW